MCSYHSPPTAYVRSDFCFMKPYSYLPVKLVSYICQLNYLWNTVAINLIFTQTLEKIAVLDHILNPYAHHTFFGLTYLTLSASSIPKIGFRIKIFVSQLKKCIVERKRKRHLLTQKVDIPQA